MILLSDVDPATVDAPPFHASFTIAATDPFYDPALRATPSLLAIEYMAQAVAAYTGLLARREGRPPLIGYLLGTRNFSIELPSFPLGHTYHIYTRLEFSDAEFAAFSATLHASPSPDSPPLASALLDFYRPL